MKYEIYTDGGARGNPGPAACACVVFDENGGKIFEDSRYIGSSTNNVAEYRGVLLAYEWLVKNNNLSETQVIFFLDSELVVKQLRGEYKIKNQNLVSLVTQVKLHEKSLESVVYTHVRREQNSLADGLVNECLDKNLQQ